MHRLSTFACATLLAAFSQGQTRDIVIFSEMGEKFTLIIDGDAKNGTPAARVVATGLKTETPAILVKFSDAGIPPLKQNAWLEPDKEYTLKITTDKKGERVLRMQGQAALGTAAASGPSSTFVEDPPADATPTVIVDTRIPENTQSVGGTQTVTTTTQTMGTSTGVNMNMGINGVGVNMSVGVSDPLMGTTMTTTTTTTTTTATTATGVSGDPGGVAIVEEPVYRMPGYNGPIGCTSLPMSDGDFNEAKTAIGGQGFDETRLTVARQIGDNNCFSTAQVKAIMGLFGFEETRLDFAKYAYGRTHDIGNYYKLNDAFNFSSSVDELNAYIKGR